MPKQSLWLKVGSIWISYTQRALVLLLLPCFAFNGFIICYINSKGLSLVIKRNYLKEKITMQLVILVRGLAEGKHSLQECIKIL